jgi:hypothetical protein
MIINADLRDLMGFVELSQAREGLLHICGILRVLYGKQTALCCVEPV